MSAEMTRRPAQRQPSDASPHLKEARTTKAIVSVTREVQYPMVYMVFRVMK